MIEDLAYKQLRFRFLNLFERKCMCCGNGGTIHLDHIKPVSIYPELRLEPMNFQVLCSDCNEGKLNTYEHDFRTPDDIAKIEAEFEDYKGEVKYGKPQKQIKFERIFVVKGEKKKKRKKRRNKNGCVNITNKNRVILRKAKVLNPKEGRSV